MCTGARILDSKVFHQLMDSVILFPGGVAVGVVEQAMAVVDAEGGNGFNLGALHILHCNLRVLGDLPAYHSSYD